MNILHLKRVALDNFWEKFGPRGSNGIGYDSWKKLEELKRLSDLIIFWRRTVTRERFRRKFNKPYRFRGVIMKRPCFICQEKMAHRHHIIQLQHGGDNSKRNIIPLCKPCHQEIHPWLREENLLKG